MILDIPEVVRPEMEELEKRDTADRIDGTSRLDRLRQIRAETGQFIAMLAAPGSRSARVPVIRLCGCRWPVENAASPHDLRDSRVKVGNGCENFCRRASRRCRLARRR